jgi:Bacterial PH domain
MTETFPIVPGDVRILWALVPAFVVLAAALGMLALSLAGSRNARFEVSPVGLRLRGDLYGRFVPAADLRLDSARAVDLQAEPGLMPIRRTVGTAVGGYQSGWFRLRDGEKALLYITDRSRVAYVPTARGYAIMVSVPDPDAFLASLRRIAPPGA